MDNDALKHAHVRSTAELVAMHETFEYCIRALALALDGCGSARSQLVEALEASARQFRGSHLSLTVTQGFDKAVADLANAAYRDCIGRSMERMIEAVLRSGM